MSKRPYNPKDHITQKTITFCTSISTKASWHHILLPTSTSEVARRAKRTAIVPVTRSKQMRRRQMKIGLKVRRTRQSERKRHLLPFSMNVGDWKSCSIQNFGFVLYGGAVLDASGHPRYFLLAPIYPTLDVNAHEQDNIVGFLVAVIPWDRYFSNLLPGSITGMIVVLNDTCGDHFTYWIDGLTATFLGHGDLHDSKFDYLEVATEFALFLHHNFSGKHEHCKYDLWIYP
jgi:hypothetical protein